MRSIREIMYGSVGLGAVNTEGRTPDDLQILAWELRRWLGSRERERMLVGQAYFEGRQDILQHGRTVIGAAGQPERVSNLPDNRLVNNQYGKLVNQKADYVLSQPITWEVASEEFDTALKRVFDRKFMRQLKGLGRDCYNHGIAWLYPYIDAVGRLRFKRFAGYEILPLWSDQEHTELEAALRFYMVENWQGQVMHPEYRVEIFDLNGVHEFKWEQERLVSIEAAPHSYMQHRIGDGYEAVNWAKIPLVAFKLNERELPLIVRVKSLQDALNQMLSQFENSLQEDAHNTILVIKNYDGTDLDEFRRNLAVYGAVKVSTVDGADGGIDTLSVQVNSENFKAIIEQLKAAIIENGMGFDAKLQNSYRAANELNIKSMYSDIALDANDFENEWQASFEELLWFVKAYLYNTGQGEFFAQDMRLIFNRDIMVDESEVIANCVKSQGIISDEAIVAQHPWVNDVRGELKRLSAQKRNCTPSTLS